MGEDPWLVGHGMCSQPHPLGYFLQENSMGRSDTGVALGTVWHDIVVEVSK